MITFAYGLFFPLELEARNLFQIKICLIKYTNPAGFQSIIYKYMKSFSAEKDMPLRNFHSK